MQRTVIVIPCFNEAARFRPEALLEARHTSHMLSFILVDDGSRDGTAGLLRELRARDPDAFELLSLPVNRGKAEAVRLGVLAAFERSPAFVGYFDADLATPLSAIGPMVARFADPDVHLVMGSRVQLLGRHVERSAARHYFGRVFASTAALVLGLDVYDTQCGAKIFRNTETMRSIFQLPFSVSWTFDVEILARLNTLAERGVLPAPRRAVVEYPLERWRDVPGSKLRPRAALKAAVDLATLWRRYRT